MSEAGPGEAPENLLRIGREVIRREAAALQELDRSLGQPFVDAVSRIASARGRVVVTGIGKSGAIARKAAATLASTGTPAFFLHPAEAAHGDLGMVTQGDLVLALSFSGETDEILALLPTLRRVGIYLIAVTSAVGSTLGENADLVLQLPKLPEACPLNLAPTTSSIAMLSLLDAVAVAAMQNRQFTSDQFALFHPAGSLGRRLLLRVRDLMRTGDRMALCRPADSVREALFSITRAQSGAVFVVDESGRFLGLLTDGDIRRRLLLPEGDLSDPVSTCMNSLARRTTGDRLVTEALALMEEAPPCSELPVLDESATPVGVLNLKDIVRAGIA